MKTYNCTARMLASLNSGGDDPVRFHTHKLRFYIEADSLKDAYSAALNEAKNVFNVKSAREITLTVSEVLE